MKYKIRSMFIAPKNHTLVQYDFSQAETWIVAHLANEPNMKWSLMNSDIHRDTAANAIFHCKPEEVTSEMRYIGKQNNHANSYGMKYMRMAQIINKQSDKPPYITVTLAQAKSYSEAWHKYYRVADWWRDIQNKLNSTRKLVTPYGRERTFFMPWGDELFKEAYAYIPQSTVGDHCNGRIHPELGIKGGVREIHNQYVKKNVLKIINQSHDSCILEVPNQHVDEIIPACYNLMRRPIVVNHEQFTIPVDCEVGTRWGELEKVKVEE